MQPENLKSYCKDMKSKYPELTDEIDNYYQLFLDEVEEGGSPDQECESCMQSIEDLIINLH